MSSSSSSSSATRTCAGCRYNGGWGSYVGGDNDVDQLFELVQVHTDAPCVSCYTWTLPECVRDCWEPEEVTGDVRQ